MNNLLAIIRYPLVVVAWWWSELQHVRKPWRRP